MKLRTEFIPNSALHKIDHTSATLLVGSCFTEHIGKKMRNSGFKTLINPHGIIFNPDSIHQSLMDVIENKSYTDSDLFAMDENWNSYNFHSKFSSPDKAILLNAINNSVKEANEFLRTANRIIITFGSAYAYKLKSDNKIVANCHKVPSYQFEKILLSVDEIRDSYLKLLPKLKEANPNLQIIFTISPVRHLKDGFIENQKSKSILNVAIHQIIEQLNYVSYFPAYEIMMDDLRDYRFCSEDMIHPNETAVNYIWEKFSDVYFHSETKNLAQEANACLIASMHKPFNSESAKHLKFKKDLEEKIKQLKVKLPHLANFPY